MAFPCLKYKAIKKSMSTDSMPYLWFSNIAMHMVVPLIHVYKNVFVFDAFNGQMDGQVLLSRHFI